MHLPASVVNAVKSVRGGFVDKSRGGAKPWTMAVGAVAFVAVTVVSVVALPTPPNPVSWPLLVVVAVLVAPITIVLSAAEFLFTSRLVGGTVGMHESMTISVLSSAANLLPLPGSYLVRMRALSRQGATASRAAQAPLFVGVLWAALAGIPAGLWLVAESGELGGWLLLGGSVVALAAALVAFGRLGSARPRHVAALTAVELAMVLASAVRHVLVLRALGFDAGVGAGVALALSSVLATATGILPGALGIKEGLAALLGPLAGVPPAAAALTAAVSRVLGLLSLAVFALVLLRTTERSEPLAAQEAGDLAPDDGDRPDGPPEAAVSSEQGEAPGR